MTSILLPYIKLELLALVPVLAFIGWMLKHKTNVPNGVIPFILTGCGVLMAGLWVFATTEIDSFRGVLRGLYTSLIQGILCAAASTFSHQLSKQWLSLRDKDK